MIQGQLWVDNVKTCLMTSLLHNVEEENPTCEEVKVMAFTNHESCYNQQQFCSTMATNKASLYSVYDLTNDFVFTKDWYLAWKQVGSFFYVSIILFYF